MTRVMGLCSHCQIYPARPKTGKCRVCEISPMTKKKIKETRVELGYDSQEPEKKSTRKRAKKSVKSKEAEQVGLFGEEIAQPRITEKKSVEEETKPEKKNRRTSRKNRSSLDRLHSNEPKKRRKKRSKSPITEEHITAYFKILAATHGEKYWMEIDHYRYLARSKLERMLSLAREDVELVDDDHDFNNHRYGEVDGERVRFVTLDEMTVLLEDLSTLTSIGLL